MGRWRRVLAYIDDVSEPWLGWTLPPVHRALESAQWAPDKPAAYCHRCGQSVGIGEASDRGCGSCRDEPRIVENFIRLGRHQGVLRQWILAIKFSQWAAMADVLGMQLGQAVRTARLIEQGNTVVVPMPMPWQRRLYRGIDHARVIAAAVARELDVPLIPCLSKGNGPPMVTLTATDRRRLGGKDMHIARRWGSWPIAGRDVLIVDDVRTTGTSLRAATRLVRSLGARKVNAAVLAVSDDPDRRS